MGSVAGLETLSTALWELSPLNFCSAASLSCLKLYTKAIKLTKSIMMTARLEVLRALSQAGQYYYLSLSFHLLISSSMYAFVSCLIFS